jgi:hypothetical protein
MSPRPLDPRICNIALDANALDLNGSAKDALVTRFRQLVAEGKLVVVLGGGVRGEVQHPNTPANVQADMLPRIFNLQAVLNASQQEVRRQVTMILQGDAQPGKHAADASHLSEAAETGCGYFITHDLRVILKKRVALARVLPPSLTIATLTEFFGVFDDYETVRRREVI